MSGMLYKDMVNLRTQGRMYVFVLIVWGAIGWTRKDAYFLAGMLTMLTLFVPLNACACDEKDGWDKFAVVTPVSRARIVLSKYVLGLLTMAVSAACSTIWFLVFRFSLEEIFFAECIFLTIGCFVLAFLLPLILKFGTEKARIMITVLILGPALLFYMVIRMDLPLPDAADLMSLVYLLPVAGVLAFAVSAFVGVWIYRKKEL